MTNSSRLVVFTFCFSVLFSACSNDDLSGPKFGNGLHNGWADQTSVVLWTRLTKNAELNREGQKFINISADEAEILDKSADSVKIYKAQIPENFTLEQMEGACPGMEGEVMLKYYAFRNEKNATVVSWMPVDAKKNFTVQWKLENLVPGTQYIVKLFARNAGSTAITDSLTGLFLTPPAVEVQQETDFCIVTCHDYPRRDDSISGHKIYKVMAAMNPDFFVHTGDVEYYDKADPYALTEELMRFKWDRLFALPYQRDFYNRFTTYFMKDDHDVLCNDSYRGMTYGTVSFERGLEIFDKEQFPSNDLPYKTIRWGKDLQIWLMEGRNYRSNNEMPDGPEKTIWGKEQKEWLFKTVTESDATFKLIISPTPILGPDRTKKGDNHANSAFKTEGDEIRAFINRFDNVFMCNGDRHWQYVTHFEGTNLWEFSTGAGSDAHAGGWPSEDMKPEHRFLRVKGGFLKGSVFLENEKPCLKFEHFDVDGNLVHSEKFFSQNNN